MSPSATTIPAANLDRLDDFYSYILDAKPEAPGATRTASWHPDTLTSPVTVIETFGATRHGPIVIGVTDDVALAGLRRRLLCLAATDGVVRCDGTRHSLAFRDPEGTATVTVPCHGGRS